ncbi:MAG: hypothetical protein EXS18_01700 [Verrucomicrobiae bacterium]|nr:hypothetical protein [Verrucomicrobiae bacterium]
MKTGDVMRGRILSETDQQVEIEVANADRTILSKRVIAKADVKSVQRETPEQAAERKSFESLTVYKLNPNAAYPTNYYPAVIAAFDKFLTTYPRSDHATQINTMLADWKAEYPQAVLAVKSGLVKFHGQWLTAQQAQALADEERSKKEALRKQQEEARSRQAQEASQQQPAQQQSQPTKKASPTRVNTGAGYQVDVNSVSPY